MWAAALPVAAMLLSHLCRLFHHHSDKVTPLHSQQWLSDSHVMKSGPLLKIASLTEKRNALMWADALPVAAMLLSYLWRLFHDSFSRSGSDFILSNGSLTIAIS